MAFATGYQATPGKVADGEIHGGSHVIIGEKNFENSLVIGRFAKVDTGRIDNMDASATPVIAGVVQRNVANGLESASVLDNTIQPVADIVISGLVTVQALTGDTPTKYAPIYAVNTAGADVGKASITATDNVLTRARYIETVASGVWLVHIS